MRPRPLQLTKQPDWSYGESDSGAAPPRTGNTRCTSPVEPTRAGRSGTRAEHRAIPSTLDDVHDAIEALIDRAIADGEEDLDDRIDDVVIAVRTHVDVTKRVLVPMVRRVGDDEGDRLADAAEAQERTLLRLVGEIDRSNARSC